ncbi:MAG TPA: lipid IV(A) 3-deoxy-D-manno-octulosonic acid transferase, partial [Burkholderiales bacterium]|nr:lipid IV(A) 3-deoxy-D-manno-octulosonic acid transferase [Burkholderiales bacterium]
MMWRAGYRLLIWLAFPFVLARLWWRGRAEPEYRRNLGERFGFYPPASGKPVIWLHAVSMGETRAAEPLLKALRSRHPDCELLITQMTATGREAAQRLLGGNVRVAWLAYDYPSAVRRFLSHFRPKLGILMETEIWFHLVEECKRSDVPLLLANARMSAKSARGYAVAAPLVRAALEDLSAVAAQTAEDAERLRSLGARAVEVTGNLKFDAQPNAGSETLAAQFRARFGARAVLLAASTREGEEELLLDALENNALGDAILVIVPRHPQRFDAVAELLEVRGLKFVRRSAGTGLEGGCDVVLGDSMGEMDAYYRACDAAFVGGSLLAYGGQNLIEACAAGVPVLIGPYTYNFAQAAEAAIAAGAAARVKDAGEVMRVARSLLQDRSLRERMGKAGIAFCAAHRGATERTVAICERVLSRTTGS